MTEMTAIEITEPGGCDVLQPTKRNIPVPQAGEVLIEVWGAGVNRPDILQRMGFYPPPDGASDLPGLEVSGIIKATGSPEDEGMIGQKICALIPGGGYAEYAVAHKGTCLPIPANMDVLTAACLPETFFTVWANVFEDGKLSTEETLLIHGGTSGIGITAIAMAHAFGAHTIATAGSDEKCAALTKLGVKAAYNYRTDDWEKEIISSGGVDVILDMVGGDYIPKNLNCLNPNGRHISIAFLGGPIGEINIMNVMRKRLTMTGSTLRARDQKEKTRLAEKLKTDVWPLLSANRITPVIDSVYDLVDASKAHQKMEESHHIGKIILKTANAT